jgi:hypothetical protein
LVARHVFDQETVWRAISLAGSIAGDGPPIITRAWRDVATLMNTPNIWIIVEAVTDELLRDRELAGCEVVEVAQYAMRHFLDAAAARFGDGSHPPFS